MDVFRKLDEYIKKMLNGKNKKKVLENTAVVIIIGIIIIIAGNSFLGKGNSKTETQPPNQKVDVETVAKGAESIDNSELETKIERILSQIEGAGKVSVLITYLSGKEIVPATEVKKTENTTNEKDTGGGTRNINQNDYENKVVYVEEQGGGKKPVVIKELQPEVKGVVVVADGAGDIDVRESIIRAIQVLTGVPAHKVQVFGRNK